MPWFRPLQSEISLRTEPGPRMSGRLKTDESQAVVSFVPLRAGLSGDLTFSTPHHSSVAKDMGDGDRCGQEVLTFWMGSRGLSPPAPGIILNKE